jgi:hypothetical protein
MSPSPATKCARYWGTARAIDARSAEATRLDARILCDLCDTGGGSDTVCVEPR